MWAAPPSLLLSLLPGHILAKKFLFWDELQKTFIQFFCTTFLQSSFLTLNGWLRVTPWRMSEKCSTLVFKEKNAFKCLGGSVLELCASVSLCAFLPFEADWMMKRKGYVATMDPTEYTQCHFTISVFKSALGNVDSSPSHANITKILPKSSPGPLGPGSAAPGMGRQQKPLQERTCKHLRTEMRKKIEVAEYILWQILKGNYAK